MCFLVEMPQDDTGHLTYLKGFIHVYGKSSYIFRYYTFLILSESRFHYKLKRTVS